MMPSLAMFVCIFVLLFDLEGAIPRASFMPLVPAIFGQGAMRECKRAHLDGFGRSLFARVFGLLSSETSSQASCKHPQAPVWLAGPGGF